jgi:bifunctional DNase/RNase
MAAPHEEASRPPNFDDPRWLPEYDKDFMEARVLTLNEHGACWLLILQPFLTPSYVLPMFIGDTEAQAIQNVRSGQKPSRPGTHDLTKSALEACNIRVIRVAVTHVLGGSFVARIWLRAQGAIQEVNIDSRPSDAIALALRFQVPIWVRRQVLFSSGSPIEKYFAVRSNVPDESERGGASSGARKSRSLFDPRPVISPDDPILNPPQAGMSSKTILAFFRNHSPFKTEAVQKLERELKECIAREDYMEAARIRDELRRLYPLDAMREEIRKAIEDQRFDDAARIRDQIIAWKLDHDPQLPTPSEWKPDLDISSSGTRDATNVSGLQSGESNEIQQHQQPTDSEEGPEESAM